MPHVDRLAKEGLRFTRACSTFRSVMITGMYQTTIGAHHHRSERGEHRIQLPYGVRSNLTPTQKPARQAAGQISNRNLHERKTKEI